MLKLFAAPGHEPACALTRTLWKCCTLYISLSLSLSLSLEFSQWQSRADRILTLKIRTYAVVYDAIVWILNFATLCLSSAASAALHCWQIYGNGGPQQCFSSSQAMIEWWFLVKIRTFRKLNTFACLGHCFCRSLLPGTLILKIGFVCPSVVFDPAYQEGTIVVALAFCLTIFNSS